jgi:signal transduction histidine kinase
LWISRGIVEAHHGSLRFRSSTQAGRNGTVFSLFLPAAQYQPAPQPA